EIFARQWTGFPRHAKHYDHGQGDESHAGEHRNPHADHLLDLAMNAEPHDYAMQGYRYDDRFEDQRDRRGNVEMRCILNEGLPSHRGGQDERVQGVNVEERIEPVLVELEEADQN